MVFDSSLEFEAVDRRAIELSLRRALSRDEFLLHYQPASGSQYRDIEGGSKR